MNAQTSDDKTLERSARFYEANMGHDTRVYRLDRLVGTLADTLPGDRDKIEVYLGSIAYQMSQERPAGNPFVDWNINDALKGLCAVAGRASDPADFLRAFDKSYNRINGVKEKTPEILRALEGPTVYPHGLAMPSYSKINVPTDELMKMYSNKGSGSVIATGPENLTRAVHQMVYGQKRHIIHRSHAQAAKIAEMDRDPSNR